MESNRSIGIALGRKEATVICIDSRSGEAAAKSFTIRLDEAGSQAPSLAAALAQAIRSKGLAYDEAAVALSSQWYAQHSLHSTFTDHRQIESTIKYDAEEATAADAGSMAVTFEILRSGVAGSDVMVYSADRQALTNILLDLQAEGIDPVTLEPDVICLARALEKMDDFSSAGEDQAIMILDSTSCTLLQIAEKGHGVFTRRFLLAPAAHRTAELARQLRLTLAAWSSHSPVHKVFAAGELDLVNLPEVEKISGFSIEKKQLSLPGISGDVDAASAAAWGAASAVGRGRHADFRKDFMPYQGRRKVFQHSLRMISISLTLVFLAAGVFFQFRSFRMRDYTGQLEERLRTEYRASMYGQNPPAQESIESKLRREYKRVIDIQKGLGPGDDKSVIARLTFILEAINSTEKDVDIQIQQISITERTMRIKGDTNSRRSTLALQDAIKEHKRLMVESSTLIPSPPRDTFEMILKPAGGEQ